MHKFSASLIAHLEFIAQNFIFKEIQSKTMHFQHRFHVSSAQKYSLTLQLIYTMIKIQTRPISNVDTNVSQSVLEKQQKCQ